MHPCFHPHFFKTDLSANFSLKRLTYLDSPSKSSGCLRMVILKSLMPVLYVQSIGTAVLDCPGVRANGIAAGNFYAGLITPTPAWTVPPLTSLVFVPVEVDK